MLSDDRIISYNMTDNLLTKGIITMNFLEERIMKDGVVKEGNILKVDSFLNHQMDVKLFKQMGEEFKRRFAGKNINKIITIEAEYTSPSILTLCDFFANTTGTSKHSATSMSELVGGAIPVVYFMKKNTSLLRLTKFRFDIRILTKDADTLLDRKSVV